MAPVRGGALAVFLAVLFAASAQVCTRAAGKAVASSFLQQGLLKLLRSLSCGNGAFAGGPHCSWALKELATSPPSCSPFLPSTQALTPGVLAPGEPHRAGMSMRGTRSDGENLHAVHWVVA